MKRSSRCRLKVLASHPIQYFTPLYRLLAAHPQIDLEVLYYRDFGVTERFDKQFAQRIRWDTDQLSGYPHRFLWNLSPISDPFNPLHAINPGALTRVLTGTDAVWMNGYTYPSNWFAMIAARLRGAALLVRSELHIDPERVVHPLDPVRDRIIRWWVRRSDAILYIGKNNYLAYLHYGADPSRLFFSPYSVDVAAMASGRRRQADSGGVSALRHIPIDRLVVLFVGKLSPRKHPQAVLELANDPGLQDRIHVVIAGSGPLEASLRARVITEGITNVTLLGFINQSELPSVYSAADIFVMPSEREPWGLVLNEAMAAGVAPVVSHAVGAQADLISDEHTGFVFESGDWVKMRAAVRRLVDDDSLRGRIAAAARERAQLYSHESAARGVLNALSHLGLISPEPPVDVRPPLGHRAVS